MLFRARACASSSSILRVTVCLVRRSGTQCGFYPRIGTALVACNAATTRSRHLTYRAVHQFHRSAQKNHRNLIEAFRALLRRRPHLPLQLVLVGHRFRERTILADWITREEPRIMGWPRIR